MHETKQQNIKNGFLLILPPMWRLVKLFALIREVASSSSCSFSSSGGENGPKGLSMVKVAQGVSKGFKSNFGRVRMLVIVDVK